MKKGWLSLLLGFSLAASANSVQAANLWEVYQQAAKSDPQFQAAFAKQMSVAEEFPLARAVLLPQLNGTSSLNYSRTTYSYDEALTSGTYAGDREYTVRKRESNVTLALTQSVFNFTNWAKLMQSRDTVKAASATYNASIQDLMERVCSAYLAVLQAQDVLRFTGAEKRAYLEQYERAKQNFHVGVATITDVYNAKAYYDTSSSSYITAANDVRNKREDLRAITNILYSDLNPFKEVIPLIVPAPMNMEQWVQTAIKQNWEVTSTRFTSLALHKAVYSAEGGHVPSVDAKANYQNDFTRYSDGGGWGRYKGPSAELDLTVPLYKGGLVNAQVRQAVANYEKAVQDQETAVRKVVDNTRKAYLGIVSGIDTVRADKQVIISNQSSLDGMEAGYRVGTRTIVDVLIAEKQLYNSQKEYAIARYNYIKSIISLKRNAGTLKEEDIQSINHWLSSTRLFFGSELPDQNTVKNPEDQETAWKEEVSTPKAKSSVTKKPAAAKKMPIHKPKTAKKNRPLTKTNQ